MFDYRFIIYGEIARLANGRKWEENAENLKG